MDPRDFGPGIECPLTPTHKAWARLFGRLYYGARTGALDYIRYARDIRP